jgi:adenosylcobinamide kinase/adenosylcobinamide-phosphate guanylyltransferase
MGRLIFISGGIKSGKSSFAIDLLRNKKTVYFIATALPTDKEMKEIIMLHKKSRPKNFVTIEETTDISSKIKNLNKKSCVLVDCINFWVANMMKKYDEEKILVETKHLCETLKDFNTSVVVSNEVGMSLVSTNSLGRKFQKILGKVNQIFVNYADRFYFMLLGVPIKIK